MAILVCIDWVFMGPYSISLIMHLNLISFSSKHFPSFIHAMLQLNSSMTGAANKDNQAAT